MKLLTGCQGCEWQGCCVALSAAQLSPAPAPVRGRQPLSSGKWAELTTAGLQEGPCSVEVQNSLQSWVDLGLNVSSATSKLCVPG